MKVFLLAVLIIMLFYSMKHTPTSLSKKRHDSMIKTDIKRLKKKKESIPDILRKEPFLTNKELAKRLDVTFSTLRRWLADYKKKGQIYFDKTGGKGQWRVRE